MQKYVESVVDTMGNVVVGATVTVKNSTGVSATIYSDNGSTVTANPMTTGNRGDFGFYAANGKYTLEVYSPKFNSGVIMTIPVILYDPAQDLLLPTADQKASFPATASAANPLVVSDDIRLATVSPQAFGATGTGDDTTALQAAIDYAVSSGLPLVQTIGHTANVTIGGAINWDANGNTLTPATNAPVITLDAGSTRTSIENLEMVLGGVDRGWTGCDGIRIVGAGGSEDYTTMRNLLIRGAPGYGLYAYGDSVTGGTVQRLHVYDSTIVDCEYANVRLEGAVLESQFSGCFFNNGCKLGANPVVTDQLTHSASPARDFRRASVELLRWYSAQDVATNQLTPNRTNFIGCNFANSEDTTGTSRTAGMYVSGGRSITVNGSNFEKPFPAIWLAKEGGTSGDYKASSRGVKIDNCTFKPGTADVNLGNPLIEWDGFSQVVIDNPNITGDAAITTDSFIHNNATAAWSGMLQTRSIESFNVTYTNGMINRAATAYSPTRLIANLRYLALYAGANKVVVGKVAAAYLDALSTVWNSLVPTFIDGQMVVLCVDPAIGGAVTVRHNSDDGAAGVLAGRFILAGAADVALSDIYQQITMQWDGVNSVWREVYRNF